MRMNAISEVLQYRTLQGVIVCYMYESQSTPAMDRDQDGRGWEGDGERASERE